MMDPGAIVAVSLLFVGGISLPIVLSILEEQKSSTTTKSTKRSERYDRIWTEVEAKGGKIPKSLNVLVASRGSGKSYGAAYRQGYLVGHQRGYEVGIDYAIQELCDADGG